MKCQLCLKEITEEEVDKTRTEWKTAPLCIPCSNQIYDAFNKEG